MKNQALTLYTLEYCGFCYVVQRAASELGIELNLVDVAKHPEARRKLVNFRGRATVPVLGVPSEDGDDREVLIGESRDIVAFLKRRAHSAA